MVAFSELDLAARLALARSRLQPLVESLAGTMSLEDEDRSLVIRAKVAGSGRAVVVLARVERDVSKAQIVGEVRLSVEVDNRLGHLELVWDDEPSQRDWLTPLPPPSALSVSDLEAAGREAMTRRLARLPGLAAAVERFLRDHEHYKLDVGAWLEVSLADLDDDDEDWALAIARLSDHIADLDQLAALIETVPPESFVTCRFCRGRFAPGADARCPHCGGAL